MVEITLFEIHLDDAEFTANAPFGEAESAEGLDGEATSGFLPGGDDEETAAAADAGGGRGPLPAIAGLGLLVVLVLVLRRVVGGEPEPVPE